MKYFWGLNPKQWAKYVKVFNEKEKERVKEVDTFNYMLAKYIAYATNDPKHFPDKPFCDKDTELKPMTDSEMEKQAYRNTIKLGGVIQ